MFPLFPVSLALAFAKEIATFVVDIFGGGQGDWDPVRDGQVGYMRPFNSHMCCQLTRPLP